MLGGIKKDLNLANKHYEYFIKPIRQTVDSSNPEKKIHFFGDYEELEKMITKFLNIEE